MQIAETIDELFVIVLVAMIVGNAVAADVDSLPFGDELLQCGVEALELLVSEGEGRIRADIFVEPGIFSIERHARRGGEKILALRLDDAPGLDKSAERRPNVIHVETEYARDSFRGRMLLDGEPVRDEMRFVHDRVSLVGATPPSGFCLART